MRRDATDPEKPHRKPHAVLKLSLADFFDAAGRLRPLQDLSPEAAAAVASFDVRRTTVRVKNERVTTEELVRVKLRDGRRAEVSRHGATTSARCLRMDALQPRRVQTRERSVGTGRTAAAAASRTREG